MKNSYSKNISKKILSDLSLRKELEDAKEAIDIAQQLYDLRKIEGLTQSQLAGLIGVSQPNIARLESGDYQSYSLRTLNKAAAALNSDIEVRITPKETQTLKQVWNTPFFEISFKKAAKKIDTKNVSKEVETSNFYNYTICQ